MVSAVDLFLLAMTGEVGRVEPPWSDLSPSPDKLTLEALESLSFNSVFDDLMIFFVGFVSVEFLTFFSTPLFLVLEEIMRSLSVASLSL